jgi:hypothetical protein
MFTVPERDVEGAGLGPRVEFHPLRGDAAGARHEDDVAGRQQAIDVGKDLGVVGEELDVVAVDLDVLDQDGVGGADVLGLLAVGDPLTRAAAGLLGVRGARGRHEGRGREESKKKSTDHSVREDPAEPATQGITEEYHAPASS